MLELPARVARQWLFRRFGWPALPFSLVCSVTFRCNSRCRTCNVWQKRSDELSLPEWEAIFTRLGHAALYITFSGGEPFLREDLADIVIAAAQACSPLLVTIPTNGLLPERIAAQTERICRACPQTTFGINLSLDGLEQSHDAIRGVPGNWQRAMRTWQALRSLALPNLLCNVHTVISRFNVEDFERIQEGLLALKPDNYLSEVAEERQELGTIGASIAPTPSQYARAATHLERALVSASRKGLAQATAALRARYYRLAVRILQERRQVIPCYAGWASGHIAPNGDVWTCCTRAEPIGNLRQSGYDLRSIWLSNRAAELRRSIKSGQCWCPMANAAYTNMLFDPGSLFFALGWLARSALARR
jgi:MoaA/NifB/PqqE/SkfB family radical SAM enzyme